MSVSCATQTDLDGLWERLSAGGEKGRFGWLKDRFGLSWRIMPPALGKMIQYKDAGRSNRVTALMRMSKLENRRFEAGLRRRRFVAGHDRLSAAIISIAIWRCCFVNLYKRENHPCVS
jgi:3-demethylubiquinone-9 3-methyltransferase